MILRNSTLQDKSIHMLCISKKKLDLRGVRPPPRYCLKGRRPSHTRPRKPPNPCPTRTRGPSPCKLGRAPQCFGHEADERVFLTGGGNSPLPEIEPTTSRVPPDCRNQLPRHPLASFLSFSQTYTSPNAPKVNGPAGRSRSHPPRPRHYPELRPPSTCSAISHRLRTH